MHLIIPVWFYGFDALMYFLSSIIGFLLSFYFYKIYSLSSEKRHMYLYLGFLLLSLGLLNLSISDTYSYIAFMNCHKVCVLGIIDNAFSLEDFSYFAYFGLSLFAYTMFLFAYKVEKFKYSTILIPLFIGYLLLILLTLPSTESIHLWQTYHEYFHLIAFLMTVFVAFRNVLNYTEKKNLNSFLVMISFSFISLFHLFHLFSFVSGWMYVFAHISMLIGFSSLLVMVLRVKK